MTKKRIIFIITFSTKISEYENQPWPKHVWSNPGGEMVGIWGLEWGDLILKSVAGHYPNYECEVWQPDLRADKVYSAHLQDRLVHRKFPAKMRNFFKTYRFINELYSDIIRVNVREFDTKQTVFMLPSTVRSNWMKDIVGDVKNAKVLYYNLLNDCIMLPSTISSTNPFKAMNHYLLNREKVQWLGSMNNLLTGNSNPEAVEQIRSDYPQMNIFPLTLGVDLEFWRRDKTKKESRVYLGIDPDCYVLVLSQRLVPEYQVDRFIETIAAVKAERPFCCYITGHGSGEYEKYLHDLVQQHQLQDRIQFVGFVSDEKLRDYFIAADIFATLAKMFAGSNGAIKAMALETPILHVNMGVSYEFLKEHGAGVYVSPTNYGGWVERIQDLINGMQVNTIPRDIVISHFSWRKTADQIHHAVINAK